jgi:hypothetical protein
LSRAREWALRCQLEHRQHDKSCFVTLTYDDHHLPPTLKKRDLSLWVKRLRERLRSDGLVRFFAAGEYGERTHRPHYHALLFGTDSASAIKDSWPFGFVDVGKLTPGSIAYVAGYCSKKVGWRLEAGERVDPATGEIYEFQPPFILMSRRPGIGGDARQYWRSWRRSAVYNGQPIAVPRFLHNAWKANATPEEIEQLAIEKRQTAALLTKENLENAEKHAVTLHNLKRERRKKL